MCAVDSTVALKVVDKPQYDTVFRGITCVDIELTGELTTDHDVGFGPIPEFHDFDFLLGCEKTF